LNSCEQPLRLKCKNNNNNKNAFETGSNVLLASVMQFRQIVMRDRTLNLQPQNESYHQGTPPRLSVSRKQRKHEHDSSSGLHSRQNPQTISSYLMCLQERPLHLIQHVHTTIFRQFSCCTLRSTRLCHQLLALS
jgi:hypothetical protein